MPDRNPFELKMRLPRRVKTILRRSRFRAPRDARDLARWRRKMTRCELFAVGS